MFVSFVALGWSVGRLTRNGLLGWLTVLLLVGDTGLTWFALLIMSESIFIALVAFHFAAVLSLLRRFSMPAGMLAGLTAGLAILLRPAGYSLLLTIPFVVALASRRRLQVAVLTAVPVGAVLILGAVVNFAMWGSLARSIGGLSLFGHVLHLAKPDVKSPHPELYRQILVATVPAVTSAHASYPLEYAHTTSSEYNKLLWGMAVPRLIAYVQEEARQEGGQAKLGDGDIIKNNLLASRVNGISMELAIGIIENDPLGYVRHVFAHLCGMWANLFKEYGPLTVRSLARAEEGTDIAKVLTGYFGRDGYPADRIRQRLIQDSEAAKLSDAIWSAIRPALRILVPAGLLLALAASGMMLFVWLKRLPPSALLAGVALCSLQIWGYFGLVVAVQAALDRYSVVFEPVLIVLFATGCAWLVAWTKALATRFGAPSELVRKRFDIAAVR